MNIVIAGGSGFLGRPLAAALAADGHEIVTLTRSATAPAQPQSRAVAWTPDGGTGAWAAEIDCASWAQVILKFIVSHRAVTCAIPATTRVDHVQENIGAATGRLPDAAMRARMIAHVEKL